MPLVFPRDMIGAHCWETANFMLRERQEVSRRASGAPQSKDLGDPHWVASFSSYPLKTRDASALYADFLTLGGAKRSFYGFPHEQKRPAAWVDENLAVVVVNDIRSDRSEIKLGGLPSGFVMTPGDFVSIEHAAGHDLYQLATGDAANGSGITGWMAVGPSIRTGVSVGDDVALKDPICELVLEPNSLAKQRYSRGRYRVTFNAWQVLR